jgi:FAD/FMN-containing dehydrogenase
MSESKNDTQRYQSWGRLPAAQHQVLHVHSPLQPLPLPTSGGSLLPFGVGRSYGDSCLNDKNALLDTSGLQFFQSFDAENSVLRVEAGVTLAQILALFMPRKRFLPVSPGTKFVTVGGAIANDIHGKNHHRAGSFGNHLRRFELLRSTGERLVCSPTENSSLFAATIGGLGLTGLITWAEFSLPTVPSPYLHTRSIKFGNIDEFIALSREADRLFEYSVAWVDCVSSGKQLGRGIFMAGNFAEINRPSRPQRAPLGVPCDLPSFALNPLSMRLFNTAYYNRQWRKDRPAIQHYEPFFYPLDGVHRWNRIYGKRGFFQYQLVVPMTDGGAALREIFQRIARSRRASFLAVLKTFGEIRSPGLLSFPRPGITLALDFPNEGAATLALMRELDAIVFEAHGALYPAKDARMSAALFERSYPQLAEFERWIDPRFSSSLWRRLRGAPSHGAHL